MRSDTGKELGQEPAFPISSYLGLSKREYFAGEAMKGLLANKSVNDPEVTERVVALASTVFADTLLDMLAKTK